MANNDQRWIAVLPVSRGRAAARALLWLALGSVLALATFTIYSSMDWGTNGSSSRLVTLSIALAALPVPCIAVATLVAGVRWLALGCWPGPIGVFASERELHLRLGPFGTHAYDAASLDVRYAFDLSVDLEEEGFEAFLPAEEQMRRFLPRLAHPRAPGRIARRVLRYVVADEEVAAATLKPAVDTWRASQGLSAPDE